MSNYSLDTTIRKFKKFGFDGIELSVVRGMTQSIMSDYLDDYVVAHTLELCAELNMKITALAAHANYVTDDFIYKVQRDLIEAAPKYGTDIVIMSTFTPFEIRESNSAALYQTLAERTRELARIAEDNGVRIAIEIEPNQLFHNVNRFMQIAEQVNSPALKINFDVGHIYLSEVDILAAVKRCKQYIVHSHIDNMCMGEHCHKLPWDGEIDLVSAYRALKQSGFDGGVSLDIYLQNYETVSPECVRYINQEVFAKL